MDHDERHFVLRKGMRVIGSDGGQIGNIDVVDQTYVIVQHGFFPQDYYIALSSIASHDDEAIYLTIPKDEAMDRGLANPMVSHTDPAASPQAPDSLLDAPDEAPAPQDVTAPDTADSDLALQETDDAIIAADEASRHETVSHDVDADDAFVATDARTDQAIGADDELNRRTVQLHQEEATATTRPVERGSVQIRKDVIEERQTFEVPVVEEEVVVTRRRVDKDVPDPAAVFTEEHVEIPLRGQEVQIETRAHVVEEIDIDKTAHRRIAEVNETVRHEELRVEGDDVAIDAADARQNRPADDLPR